MRTETEVHPLEEANTALARLVARRGRGGGGARVRVDVGRAGGMLVEWTAALAEPLHPGHGGSRQAAAIAYYVLLSLFPLILFLASVAGLVLQDERAARRLRLGAGRRAADDRVGRDEIESALRGVSANAGTIGLISLVTLLWTASGMMGAIRGSLDAMDPETPPRPVRPGEGRST